MLRFKRYVPGLKERGIDLRALSATPTPVRAKIAGAAIDWDREPAGTWLPPVTLDGCKTYRIRLPDTDGVRRKYLLSRKLLEFCKGSEFRPHVVQFLSLPPAMLPALVGLRSLGIASVVTKTMITELPKNGFKRLLWRPYMRMPFEFVDYIVTGSSAMKQSMLEFNVHTPIHIIGHGVDLRRFRPAISHYERMEVRARLGIPADHYVLLFVGSVDERKGIDLLLESWSQLTARRPNVHIVIVGPRADRVDPRRRQYNQKLERIAQQSGAPDRIHFAGLSSTPEKYYRSADVFVFASKREGLPNVVMEAMACGLPVVTTPFRGITPELGTAGKHYLLVEREPARFASEVERLLTDAELRARLGEAARSWVTTRMDLEDVLDEYADLYKLAANHAQSLPGFRWRRHSAAGLSMRPVA